MNPLKALPQRYPFVLLDRILEWEAGSSAAASRQLTHGDPLLDGEGNIMPLFFVEAMAQCAGIAAADPERRTGGVLVRIERFRCRRGVAAGDSLHVTARIVRVFGQIVKARAVVRIDRCRVAAAELTLQKTPSNGDS